MPLTLYIHFMLTHLYAIIYNSDLRSINSHYIGYYIHYIIYTKFLLHYKLYML